MTTQVQSNPISGLPFTYVTGLTVSRTSNTVLSVAAGQCRDSADIIDMPIGSAPLNGQSTTAPVSLNFAVTGYNGLDAGSIAASKVYAIYVIGDSSYRNPVGVMASLASNSIPTMPFGYDSYRIIGYWVSDASSHLLAAYVSGSGNTRTFTYDAPQATAVTAGTSSTYAAVTLTAFVPPVNNSLVFIQTDYTANAAADILKLQGVAETGDAVTIIAPVAGATAHTVTCSQVLAQLASGLPKINYKVSAGAVAVNVTAFQFSL